MGPRCEGTIRRERSARIGCMERAHELVGRLACYVDALGGRQGCQVIRTLVDGSVEVKGTGNAAGTRWVCSAASLEVLPIGARP